jgi:hypothetical protein
MSRHSYAERQQTKGTSQFGVVDGVLGNAAFGFLALDAVIEALPWRMNGERW